MLSNELEAYLDHISQYLCAPTVASHRSTLTRFVNESQDSSITADGLTAQAVAEYLNEASDNYSWATLHGEISTIANFVGYVRNEDPELISKQIRERLAKQSGGIKQGYTRNNSISKALQTAVETYLEYARNRAYGTRVHAATEIIVATGCRLGSLRALNVGNVDLDTGEIELSTPKKHAVSQTGLVTTRTKTLPEETVRALRTYIEHERVSSSSTSSTDGLEPLFTTPQGRVSTATLRRSMQAMMDAACAGSLNDDSTCEVVEDDADGECTQLSPSDIRRYYIAQLIEE
jgi:site-specific recombinase XerD